LLDQESASLKREINYDIEEERMRLLNIVRKQLTNKQRVVLEALLNGRRLQEIANEWGARYGSIQTLKLRTIRKAKDIILKIKDQEELHEATTIQETKNKIQEAQGEYIKITQGGV
jgi:DNA-binding CsgD family transcriptional regulator